MPTPRRTAPGRARQPPTNGACAEPDLAATVRLPPGNPVPCQNLEAAPTTCVYALEQPGDDHAVAARLLYCNRHAENFVAARLLLPRDRDVLACRRNKHRTELAGKRWAVEHEGPLARGAEAERLIERARAWAELHPLH
jgi:hypothetical protein